MLTCTFSHSYGTGSDALNLPYGITSSIVTNTIYLTDCNNNRIVSLHSNGDKSAPTFLKNYGGPSAGTGKGKFNCPRLLTFEEKSGYLYVADGGNNRIVQFKPSKFASTFTSFGSLPSTCNIGFKAPRGVTTDPNSGQVWVTDSGNNRVVRFDPLNYQTSCTVFGAIGSGVSQFDYPYGIALDKKGLIYVADANNRRIVRFDSTNFLSSFTSFGTSISGGPNFGTALRSLLYDTSSGYMYAGDASNNRIIRFHPTNFAGTFESFGVAGSGPGQFNYPYALAFDSFGIAFVTDSNNNRVESFRCVDSQVIPTIKPTKEPTSEPTDEPTEEPTMELTLVGQVSRRPVQATIAPTLAFGASYRPSKPIISRYPSIAPAAALSNPSISTQVPLLVLLTLLALVPLGFFCCCLLCKKFKFTDPDHHGETATETPAENAD